MDFASAHGLREGAAEWQSAIKFGTSGWRAIVADEFTVANIRLAVAGIAEYVKTQPQPHRVLVGRDPRFLGECFVAEAARVLAGAGVTPIVIPDPAPTPAIAYAVRTLKTSGAINFTASHNPPEYNGIKYSTPDGAPALPEVTKQIEAAIDRIADTGGNIPCADPPAGGFETADVKPNRSSSAWANSSTSRPSPNPASRWSSIPSGARAAAIAATSCARPASRSKPCTTTAMSSSAATRRSPTITCWASARRR